MAAPTGRSHRRHPRQTGEFHESDRSVLRSFAVLGGTFDPVHCGHLRVAIEVAERLGLDEVRLLPAPKPRLRDTPTATPTQRIEMLRAAVDGIARLSVDTLELDLASDDQRTRSVDTLRHLRERQPDTSISFIVGADAFSRFDQWHDFTAIPGLAHLVVVERPGARLPHSGPVADLLAEHATSDAGILHSATAGHIVTLDIPALDISASQLRAYIAAQRSIDFLTPPAVQRVIERDSTYQHAN